jgi:hypothetical protein
VTRNLSRAGKRLIGFCRTNLFKRLESSGHSFLLSVRRHILRNFIFLHALENGLPLPVGTQDSSLFDTRTDDHDSDSPLFGDEETKAEAPTEITARTLEDFRKASATAYSLLKTEHGSLFDWLRPELFTKALARHLKQDAERMFSILELAGNWNPALDEKLAELVKLLTNTHPQEKVLIFSQFADTVRYLSEQFQARGLIQFAAVTGDTEDPSESARRFSPDSNKVRDRISAADELRILIATDVLSEGQNLQDAAIIVNYDLPWAIIRLIQRAGRVDRIGQKAEKILCYSFLPAEGVERIIGLRSRVRKRLKENAEVVGSDESFFDGDILDREQARHLHDLFTEKSGILDDDQKDDEVDLASLAYQVWKNASDADPKLKKIIPNMPNVVFSTKSLADVPSRPAGTGGPTPTPGVMVYVRTPEGNDALAWVDEHGRTVTESQYEILCAASCAPSTPSLPRLPRHHSLVSLAVAGTRTERLSPGGQLGRRSSARHRAYERLKDYASRVKDSIFDIKPLHQAIDAIYSAPLTETARDLLNREMKSGIDNDRLAQIVISLHEEGRLCVPIDSQEAREPQIICSLGIKDH